MAWTRPTRSAGSTAPGARTSSRSRCPASSRREASTMSSPPRRAGIHESECPATPSGRRRRWAQHRRFAGRSDLWPAGNDASWRQLLAGAEQRWHRRAGRRLRHRPERRAEQHWRRDRRGIPLREMTWRGEPERPPVPGVERLPVIRRPGPANSAGPVRHRVGPYEQGGASSRGGLRVGLARAPGPDPRYNPGC